MSLMSILFVLLLLFYEHCIQSFFVGHVDIKFCNVFHIEWPGTVDILTHVNALSRCKFSNFISFQGFIRPSYLLVQIYVEMLDSFLGALLLTLWTVLWSVLWIVMLCSHFMWACIDTSSEIANWYIILCSINRSTIK